MGEVIYLKAYSEKTDNDWYGDYSYYGNPLNKYSDSKHCNVKGILGGGRSTGYEYILVKTTKEFLEYMGWEDDLKYQVTEKEWERK